MADLDDDIDWDLLMRRIRAGKCTPFIGAGACHGTLPLGGEIASAWANEHHYPLSDRHDLARVAQYLAIKRDAQFPKDLIVEQYFQGTASPNLADVNQLHRVLAELPFPIYVTTNYDDFMMEALRRSPSPPKWPTLEVCRWNSLLRDRPSIFDPQRNNSGLAKGSEMMSSVPGDVYAPTPERPVVFHLHGHHTISESLVLTEDDYLDFLINVSRDETILPARIQRAFSATSLMFVGYSLNDWDFRVLFRGLSAYVERSQVRKHVSVQLVRTGGTDSDQDLQRERDYLSRYFRHQSIQVYWGSCAEFGRELRERWGHYVNA
jgi:hypothetical protein